MKDELYPGAARTHARIGRMFVPVGKLSRIAAAVILLAAGGTAPATPPFCGTNPAATARMTRLRAYFAAFDAPWRLHDVGAAPEEAHWGLYDERRQPKPVVASIKPLDPSGR